MVMESWFVIHDLPHSPRRKKRKHANLYDPNAKRSDLDYMEDYGL